MELRLFESSGIIELLNKNIINNYQRLTNFTIISINHPGYTPKINILVPARAKEIFPTIESSGSFVSLAEEKSIVIIRR